MSISDIISDVKGGIGNFNDLIPLATIKTEDDLNKLNQKGINIPFCKEDFVKKFKSVDINFIFLKASNYFPEVIYLDLNKYIYKPIPIYGRDCTMLLLNEMNEEECLNKFIQIMNNAYKEKDYTSLLYSVPDSLRFQLFFKMLEDNFLEKTEAYKIFRELYTSSDFGFTNISNEDLFLNLINSKPTKYVNKLNKRLMNFPDTITVYRGEGDKSTYYKDGALSWTLDLNVANFFANRYSKNYSNILIANVKKENIIDYLKSRDEEEILVLPKDIVLQENINCLGLQDLENDCLLDTFIFNKFKTILKSLNFKDIKDHNKSHSLRVLFLALLISSELELSDYEQELLSLACVNHDRGRTHDKDCSIHGKKSFDIVYNEKQLEVLELEYEHNYEYLDFLITYHCKDDKDAIRFLEEKKYEEKDMLLNLLYILKDADALDRVRFGLRNLDMNYLRINFSRRLSLIARLLLENLKL